MTPSFNLEHEEIFPYVVVYKNLFSNHPFFYRVVKNQIQGGEDYLFDEWKDWYGFGDKTENIKDPFFANNDKAKTDNAYSSQLLLIKAIYEARIAAFGHYFSKYNIQTLEEMHIQQNFQIARYNVDISTDETGEMVMLYHTDFSVEHANEYSMNFLVTANIYFNDDYEGGGLRFTDLKEIATYKPKAGEIVVFPSGSPHFPDNGPIYHGVDKVHSNQKYFSRNYIMYKHSPKINNKRAVWDSVIFDDTIARPNQLVIRDGKMIINESIKSIF